MSPSRVLRAAGYAPVYERAEGMRPGVGLRRTDAAHAASVVRARRADGTWCERIVTSEDVTPDGPAAVLGWRVDAHGWRME